VHRSWDGAAAAIASLRNRDTQLALGERRLGLRGVARTCEAHDAREPAVAALDQLKARLAADAPRGLLADDKNTVRLREDAHGRGIDARHVNQIGRAHV